MGPLHSFLGMKVTQNEETGDIWIGREAYIDRVLSRFGMQDSKPVCTPSLLRQLMKMSVLIKQSINQQ